MDDVLKAALEDAGDLGVEDTSIKAISKLALDQVALELEIAETEKTLSELNAKLKKVSEIDLPNAMLEAGMRSFKLSNGGSVSVAKFYGASILVENRETAYAWMVENGHASLIKTGVEVNFGKGQEERDDAKKFLEELKEDGFEAKLSESVHHSTLKAFVKEQLELPEPTKFPECFTIFVGEKAKVILPKPKD